MLEEAIRAARSHHPGLEPLFSPRAVEKMARHFKLEEAKPAAVIADPSTEDRDLRFLVQGQAVRVRRVPGEPPETLRKLTPPVTFNTTTFAIGRARTTSVVAVTATKVLRISPKALRVVAFQEPAVAVGLLRWAALDLVDAIREHRLGVDDWSKRHGRRGTTERVFEATNAAREKVEVDPACRALAEEGLRGVTCFQGRSIEPLSDGLGHHLDLITVAADQSIIANGEIDGSVYLLLDGRAATFGPHGQVLESFRSGGGAQEVFIGETEFLAQGPRDGTVTATSDCLLLRLPRSAVDWLLEAHPGIAVLLHKAMLRTLCWRALEATEERERFVDALKGTVAPAPVRR